MAGIGRDTWRLSSPLFKQGLGAVCPGLCPDFQCLQGWRKSSSRLHTSLGNLCQCSLTPTVWKCSLTLSLNVCCHFFTTAEDLQKSSYPFCLSPDQVLDKPWCSSYFPKLPVISWMMPNSPYASCMLGVTFSGNIPAWMSSALKLLCIAFSEQLTFSTEDEFLRKSFRKWELWAAGFVYLGTTLHLGFLETLIPRKHWECFLSLLLHWVLEPKAETLRVFHLSFLAFSWEEMHQNHLSRISGFCLGVCSLYTQL